MEKILAAYLSDGKKSYFCPLTSCSIQKEERVPSVCETSALGQACTAMCIFQMCPLRSVLFLQQSVLESSGHPGLSRFCRLRTPVIEVSRAQRITQHAYIVSLCTVHLFTFPACFAWSGFFSWVYAVLLPVIYYISSKSCSNRNLSLKSPLLSVQSYTSGAAVTVSCGCRMEG